MPKKAHTLTVVPKAPELKSGRNSKVVAKQLDKLITDAESGLRRVITAGLFILEVTQDLPHGQFGPWLEVHLPNRNRTTVWRWKSLALNVLEACGANVASCNISDTPAYKILSLPAAKVPKAAKELREKMDSLIEGKTYKQLFFDFKQAEEVKSEDGEVTVVPRRGGDVAPRGPDGKRTTKRRRTNKQITTETFEADSLVALESITTAFDTLFGITGPNDEKAWDTLDDEALEALKMNAKDLYDAAKATQERRKAKR